MLRTQITPHGKAGRIQTLVRRHGYRLPFRALTAGTVKVGWYRALKGHRPILIATGSHTFGSARKAHFKMTLTKAGRRALRHAKHLPLFAKGTFTRPHAPPVTAKRGFALKR
jgi:hypothetical protein